MKLRNILRYIEIGIKKYDYPLYLKLNGILLGAPKKNGIDKNRKEKVIISLTTYPARIDSVHITLCTLLRQTVKPSKVILWLAREQFPNGEADLPEDLLALIPYGLEIDWYNDIKSYKKLIPALKKYGDSIIVTADDDAYYPRKWLELLLKSYHLEPQSVHTNMITALRIEDGNIRTAEKSKEDIGKPLLHNKVLGVNGVLYPPGSLHEDVVKEEIFMELAPHNDDLWFWCMALINGTRIVWCDKGNKKFFPTIIDTVEQESIWNLNNSTNTFNIEMDNLCKRYNLVEILKGE